MFAISCQQQFRFREKFHYRIIYRNRDKYLTPCSSSLVSLEKNNSTTRNAVTFNFSDNNIDYIIDENTRYGIYLKNRSCIVTSLHGLVYIATNSQSFLLSQRAALANGVRPIRNVSCRIKGSLLRCLQTLGVHSRIVIGPFRTVSIVQWFAKRALYAN